MCLRETSHCKDLVIDFVTSFIHKYKKEALLERETDKKRKKTGWLESRDGQEIYQELKNLPSYESKLS